MVAMTDYSMIIEQLENACFNETIQLLQEYCEDETLDFSLMNGCVSFFEENQDEGFEDTYKQVYIHGVRLNRYKDNLELKVSAIFDVWTEYLPLDYPNLIFKLNKVIRKNLDID